MTTMIRKPGGEWEPAIRKLTELERDTYAGAVVQAVSLLPAWRDTIALLRPFYDATAGTAYVDKFSRAGLSPWFFEDLNAYQRASVILHETSHVLYNCFLRGEVLGADPQLNNIASDFEINTGLDTIPRVDLSFAIFPDRGQFTFPANLTQEQYYHLLKESGFQPPKPQQGPQQADPDCPQHGKDADKGDKGDKGDQPGGSGDKGESGEGGDQPGEDGQGGSGDQPGDKGDGGEGNGEGAGDQKQDGDHGHSPNGAPCTCPPEQSGNGQPGQPGEGGKPGTGDPQSSKGCDEVTEERVENADDAGVERASDAEQSIAKKNTAVRVADEAKKARQAGNSHMADFLDLSLAKMSPPKVNWRTLFRKLISRMDDTIVRGRSDYSYRRTSRRLSNSQFIFPGMVKYEPSAMVGIDTSGSMSLEDHQATAYEVEGILKSASSVRSRLRVFSVDTRVSNVKPVESVSKLDLRGGGGTDMSVGWAYVNSLKPREKPDIFILATDGYTAWEPVEEQVLLGKKYYKSVLLVTTEGGYKSVPESLKRLIPVFDISEGRS